MFVFRKIWRALISCYLRFEILPFSLLPTTYPQNFLPPFDTAKFLQQ